eukprot:15219397-Alexandrium_andersonii.AAC.1
MKEPGPEFRGAPAAFAARPALLELALGNRLLGSLVLACKEAPQLEAQAISGQLTVSTFASGRASARLST